MPTVTINAVDYAVYADVDTADEFLAADFSATLWRAETDPDQKARADVSSTRLLNRLNWASDRDWPRPGTDDEQDEDIPQPVIDASIVLAKLIHAGSTVDSSASTQTSNIKSQRAGSVAIDYFTPVDEATRLPVEIEELLGPYLASVAIGSLAFGTCGESIARHGFRTGFEAS